MLSQFQLEFETAINGEKAIYAVKNLFETQKRTYNLILMDYNMPVFNGIQATKIIRKFLKRFAPHLPKPHICCLTSYVDETLKQEMSDAKMDSFVLKPIFKKGI